MEKTEVIDFVKALSQPERLRVIGALVQKNATLKDIAQELDMPVRETAQHLAMLAHAGIVREKNQIWELDTKTIEGISRRQFKDKIRSEYTPSSELSEKPRKVLATFLNPDGSIKQLPSEPGKLQIILDYLLNAFNPGEVYTEKEVNEIIRRFHLDTAGLRRDLVDHGMLQRKSDGSQYWRPQ